VNFTVIVGDTKPESRTLTVAAMAADALADGIGLTEGHQLIDLSALARRLLLAEPCAAVEDAVEQVLRSDLLLVASPTVKGTYTGLLKVFIDRLPHRGLSGGIALPLLVMSGPRHALAVEVHLRQLLVELGASVPASGLAVLESDLGRLDEVLRSWATEVADALGHPPGRLARARLSALAGRA
jgi:FMN reductase